MNLKDIIKYFSSTKKNTSKKFFFEKENSRLITGYRDDSKNNKIIEKGKVGEKAVHEELLCLGKEYIVYKNLLLEYDNHTTQIDHIIISKYGIFVIETKNYNGLIFGKERDINWTSILNKKKYGFKNPLHQNFGHITQISKITGLSLDKFISIIVFSDKTNIKNLSELSQVVQVSNLIKKIKSYTNNLLTTKEIIDAKDYILLSNINSRQNEKIHIGIIKENLDSAQIKTQNNICPRCGGKLVLRKGKYNEFLGCSSFPKCKFTKSIEKINE